MSEVEDRRIEERSKFTGKPKDCSSLYKDQKFKKKLQNNCILNKIKNFGIKEILRNLKKDFNFILLIYSKNFIKKLAMSIKFHALLFNWTNALESEERRRFKSAKTNDKDQR